MATSTFETQNMKLDGKTLSLFGVKGFLDGEYWCMNIFCGAFVQVDPDPASPEIINVIKVDTEEGNFDKIAYIKVSPNTGVRLYLEGIITEEMIRGAKEEDGVVIFKDVKLPGQKPFLVIVDPESEYACSTFDAEGNFV